MKPFSIVRNYHRDDFDRIKAIHESTKVPYDFPNINAPIFMVKKVLEVNGEIRMALGAYIQAELYLWMDQSSWADPETKFELIREMDKELIKDLWLKGVDEAVLCVPPGMSRFGERISDPKNGMGFTKGRDGWVHYSKSTETK